MPNKAREFIDTFVFASVHEDAPYAPAQGDAAIEQLAGRCVDLAQDNDITKADLEAEVGDLAAHFRAVIDWKNANAAPLGISLPAANTKPGRPSGPA